MEIYFLPLEKIKFKLTILKIFLKEYAKELIIYIKME